MLKETDFFCCQCCILLKTPSLSSFLSCYELQICNCSNFFRILWCGRILILQLATQLEKPRINFPPVHQVKQGQRFSFDYLGTFRDQQPSKRRYQPTTRRNPSASTSNPSCRGNGPRKRAISKSSEKLPSHALRGASVLVARRRTHSSQTRKCHGVCRSSLCERSSKRSSPRSRRHNVRSTGCSRNRKALDLLLVEVLKQRSRSVNNV